MTADRPSIDVGGLPARVALLRERVAQVAGERSAGDPTSDDPLRGLYLSEAAVGRLLRPLEDSSSVTGPTESAGSPDALDLLAGRLCLTELDVWILLLALAPDVDRTFEPLYGYLNDDVSRCRPTVGLALDLCGVPAHSVASRARFHPSAPLTASGLVEIEEPGHPFLSRALRVPDRVTAHLLGDDTPDALLGGYARLMEPCHGPPPAEPVVARLATRLAAGPLTVHLCEHQDGDGLACATAALGAAGLEALHLTPGARPAGSGADDEPRLVTALLREALLRDCAIVVAPLPEKPGPLTRALAVPGVSVVFAGGAPYDPRWYDRHGEEHATGPAPLVLDAPRRRTGDLAAWSAALGLAEGAGDGADGADGAENGAVRPGFDLAPVVAPYRLGGDGIRRTARAAQELAAFDDTPLSTAHIRLAARQQTASGLEQHARRIRPEVAWKDLVLPERPLAQLRELTQRARHRDRVLGDWRLSAGGGRGRSALALFAGASGTGKTLSAEVVAADLGLDLYVVQLSSIVDKYVGETEKNLERIFSEADRTDAVLLFDEADAVFGRRSEVKGAQDRYANMESAYLLQRLESFDGVALLTTNLPGNIDEAFTRRLDLVVEFPFPDADQRLALWRHSLAHVPCADDTDPGPCAREFELAGGSIRGAVVTAAYTAAERGTPVTTGDLLAGARREYRKAGRLVLDESSGW